KIYDTDNINDDTLQDNIYTTDSWEEFASAYVDAETYVTSNDTRLVTDTYEALDKAKKDLKALASVSKQQFRTALKNYETLIGKMSDYDSWRRGNIGGWQNLSTGNFWALTDGSRGRTDNSMYTFEELLDLVTGSGAVALGWWGQVIVPGATGVSYVDHDVTYVTGVKEFINDKYDYFDSIKTATKTTDVDIVAAYNACNDAIMVFDSWTADNTTRATKTNVNKLLTQYHAQLVAKYTSDAAAAFYTSTFGEAPKAGWTDDSNYNYGAALTAPKAGTATVNGKEQKISKGSDVLKYVDVAAADVTDAALNKAMQLVEDYIAVESDSTLDKAGKTAAYKATGILDIDDTGVIGDAPSGSVTEWTLIYRYLKYALEDVFKGSAPEVYKKADVVAIINDAYDLCDVTGDASIFNDNHMALVEARQDALAWVAAANKDKTYKDGNAVDGLTATQVYKNVQNAYKALNDQLANYKYSYGEIYDKIAAVADAIDSGDLVAADDLVSAMNACARLLSTFDASDDENEAWTADREFISYNRLYTKSDDNNRSTSEKDLLEAYTALLDAEKAQTEKTVALGDVNEDGAVNALDAREILMASVGLRDAIANEVGDVNGDGAVNALDAKQILMAAVGL
ncbi:MAG: dockerin type I domain-containing protein, partial [Oscillospiraceae bacterium]